MFGGVNTTSKNHLKYHFTQESLDGKLACEIETLNYPVKRGHTFRLQKGNGYGLVILEHNIPKLMFWFEGICLTG